MEETGKSRQSLYCALVFAAAGILLAADQIIKNYVLLLLKPIDSVKIIDGLLEFTYVENNGVAFGMFKGQLWLIGIVTAITFVIIIVLLFRYRKHTVFSYISSSLLIAGGIGNFIDRLRFGFVVDFIHVLFFDYIFNFADCCITVGACLFVIHVLRITYLEKAADGKNEEQEDTHE